MTLIRFLRTRFLLPLCSTTSFAELESYIHKNGEAKRTSGKQELYEVLINKYV